MTPAAKSYLFPGPPCFPKKMSQNLAKKQWGSNGEAPAVLQMAVQRQATPAVPWRAGAGLRLVVTATVIRSGSAPGVRLKGRKPRNAALAGKQDPTKGEGKDGKKWQREQEGDVYLEKELVRTAHLL